MASTLELEFTGSKQRTTVEKPHRRAGAGEANASALEDYIEEMWKKFDTPPLSPERENELIRAAAKLKQQSSKREDYSSDLVACVAQLGQLDSSDPTYPLLGQLLECEQLLALDEDTQSDSQSSITTEFVDLESNLIQDCMWNSQIYEPRHIYTPAPSPPPPSLSSGSSGDEMDVPEPAHPPATASSSVPVPPLPSSSASTSASRSEMEKSGGAKLPPFPKTKRHYSYPRIQPKAVISESDEEIDVVTVVERPKIAPSLRKRPASVSTSAPCSHAPSPTSSPLKSIRKRRYHTKRLQRLSSQAEDYTESDDEQRRASHNVLERKRRNDLKYSFQVLRCQIPDLEENHRAPKVTILRKAAEFIQQMQVRDARLEEEYTRKKLRRAQLLERMAQLRGVPISAV